MNFWHIKTIKIKNKTWTSTLSLKFPFDALDFFKVDLRLES